MTPWVKVGKLVSSTLFTADAFSSFRFINRQDEPHETKEWLDNQ